MSGTRWSLSARWASRWRAIGAAVVSAVLAITFVVMAPATGWNVTVETGWHGSCFWEDTVQHGPQRPSAGTYDNSGGCSRVGVRLKFDSGYTDDCSVSYILTNWYSDNNAKVVVGTKGSAACKGYHYHRLSNGYTHYNYTYPCSPYPC